MDEDDLDVEPGPVPPLSDRPAVDQMVGAPSESEGGVERAVYLDPATGRVMLDENIQQGDIVDRVPESIAAEAAIEGRQYRQQQEVDAGFTGNEALDTALMFGAGAASEATAGLYDLAVREIYGEEQYALFQRMREQGYADEVGRIGGFALSLLGGPEALIANIGRRTAARLGAAGLSRSGAMAGGLLAEGVLSGGLDAAREDLVRDGALNAEHIMAGGAMGLGVAAGFGATGSAYRRLRTLMRGGAEPLEEGVQRVAQARSGSAASPSRRDLDARFEEFNRQVEAGNHSYGFIGNRLSERPSGPRSTVARAGSAISTVPEEYLQRLADDAEFAHLAGGYERRATGFVDDAGAPITMRGGEAGIEDARQFLLQRFRPVVQNLEELSARATSNPERFLANAAGEAMGRAELATRVEFYARVVEANPILNRVGGGASVWRNLSERIRSGNDLDLTGENGFRRQVIDTLIDEQDRIATALRREGATDAVRRARDAMERGLADLIVDPAQRRTFNRSRRMREALGDLQDLGALATNRSGLTRFDTSAVRDTRFQSDAENIVNSLRRLQETSSELVDDIGGGVIDPSRFRRDLIDGIEAYNELLTRGIAVNEQHLARGLENQAGGLYAAVGLSGTAIAGLASAGGFALGGPLGAAMGFATVGLPLAVSTITLMRPASIFTRVQAIRLAVGDNNLTMQGSLSRVSAQLFRGLSVPPSATLSRLLPRTVTRLMSEEDRRETYQEIRSSLRELSNPEAMERQVSALTENLSAEVSPELGNHASMTFIRGIRHLNESLPEPNGGLGLFGDEELEPSSVQMQDFIDRFTIFNQPLMALELLADNALSQSHVEALDAIWPALAQQMRMNVMEMLMEERQGDIPYQHKMALATFLNMPVDPTMRPDFVFKMQQSYSQTPAQAEAQRAAAPRRVIPDNFATNTLSGAQGVAHRLGT